MLGKRYRNDGKHTFELNKRQIRFRDAVAAKIASGSYSLKAVDCNVCGKNDFLPLAEKDRYGLPCRTVICKECGLVQTNPRMPQSNYTSFYDKEYRGMHMGTKHPVEEYFAGQKYHGKEILDVIEIKTGKKFTGKFVVEIGCGAGGILIPFRERGNHVLGFDLGSEYIAFGKKKGIDVRVGTVDKLASLNEKPDLVIYSHVVEHLLDPVGEMKKLTRFLKKDSLVYIEVPGIRRWIAKTCKQDTLRFLQLAHTYLFSLRTLLNVLRKAGYRLVYGNEAVHALFRLGKVKRGYVSDYQASVSYLRKLEQGRRNPLNVHRIKLFVFGLFVKIAQLTGTTELARRVYYLKYGSRKK